MKKSLFFIVICVFILAVFSLSVGAASDIRVLLDGKQIEFDVPPQIVSDRTMVPIRAIFEALGAEVTWNPSTRTATATIDDYTVECTIDRKWMTVRGDTVKMDVAPVIIGGRTLVPARFAAEAFGGVVGWDGNTRTVHITSAAALPAPEVKSVLCAKHSFDVRGYCTACGFASDYQAIDVEDTAYIVTEDGAEMRLRGYAVEKVIGRLQKDDRITVTLQVSNPFNGVWYMAEKDGQKFLVYSGDVRMANVLSLSTEKETDISETSFTIHATCTYTQKLPDYVAIYVGTGNTLNRIAETSEINSKNGSFSITCNVGKLMSLAPDTTYFYQIHAYSDGILYKSAARAVTTAAIPVQTTQSTVAPMTPEAPKEEKFLGYQEGYGSAKTAWGKTLVVSVFVDDKESSWDNETASMQLALSKLNRAMSWLAEQCRSYKADTEIVCDWGAHADLFYRMDFSNAPYSDQQALLLDKIDTEKLLQQYGADNIIYILFYNKLERSGAASIRSKASGREYDTVNLYFKGQYVDADMYPDGEWVSTYAHEVAHCFGAFDLYRGAPGIPDAYKDYLYEQMFQKYDNRYDIMLGPQVDEVFEKNNYLSELDAYYMGLVPYCADIDTWGLPKVGIE